MKASEIPTSRPQRDAFAGWPGRASPNSPLRRISTAIARHQRRWIIVLYLLAVIVSTIQRGVLGPSHTTFPIFRQSFHHLTTGEDLYAAYPAEQGAGLRDLFKYSPSAALLFGPFAGPRFALGLLLWNLVNAAVLLIAIARLLPRPEACLALMIVLPATLSALQSSSSNALIAGLIVLAFTAIEEGRQFSGAALIATGTLFKLFPIAAVLFALPLRRRLRFAGALAVVFIALLAAPLLVTPLHTLALQYGSWWRLLRADSADLQFGYSLMHTLRSLYMIDLPNWPMQLAATIALVTPLPAIWTSWSDPRVRRLFLSSVLIFVVVFNHQAEHQSFVIASVGLAVWYVASPRSWWRSILMLLCVAGLDTIPYFFVWMTIQADLWHVPAGKAGRRPLGREARCQVS